MMKSAEEDQPIIRASPPGSNDIKQSIAATWDQ
jgi:hypothetical protein